MIWNDDGGGKEKVQRSGGRYIYRNTSSLIMKRF